MGGNDQQSNIHSICVKYTKIRELFPDEMK